MPWKTRLLGTILFFGGIALGCFFTNAQPTNSQLLEDPDATSVASPKFTRAWNKSALLLIDVQQDFWGIEVANRFPRFPSNVTNLLQTCRDQRIEVIHVRSEFDPTKTDWPESFKTIFANGILCKRGTDGAKPTNFATERPGERVFHKQTFNGFTNKDLFAHLQSRGIKHVFVAGLSTEVCVLSTAFGAVNNGLLVTLVEDCCATQHPKSHRHIFQTYGIFLFDSVRHHELSRRLGLIPVH